MAATIDIFFDTCTALGLKNCEMHAQRVCIVFYVRRQPSIVELLRFAYGNGPLRSHVVWTPRFTSNYVCVLRQIVFFMGVFIVQNTQAIAIIFPFMTLMCIPGRLYVLPKFLEGWELLLLDGHEEEIDEWLAIKEGTAPPKAMVESGAEEDED